MCCMKRQLCNLSQSSCPSSWVIQEANLFLLTLKRGLKHTGKSCSHGKTQTFGWHWSEKLLPPLKSRQVLEMNLSVWQPRGQGGSNQDWAKLASRDAILKGLNLGQRAYCVCLTRCSGPSDRNYPEHNCLKERDFFVSCRKEFLKLLTESRLHPMSVEFSDVSDITMDSTRTAVRIIVLRSNLSGDTIGVKAIWGQPAILGFCNWVMAVKCVSLLDAEHFGLLSVANLENSNCGQRHWWGIKHTHALRSTARDLQIGECAWFWSKFEKLLIWLQVRQSLVRRSFML